MNTYCHIGLDFIDALGKRNTSVCLVDRDAKKTIGICGWKSEDVTRLITIDGIDHNAFLKEARELRENSIPVRFIETKLP